MALWFYNGTNVSKVVWYLSRILMQKSLMANLSIIDRFENSIENEQHEIIKNKIGIIIINNNIVNLHYDSF